MRTSALQLSAECPGLRFVGEVVSERASVASIKAFDFVLEYLLYSRVSASELQDGKVYSRG